MYREISDYGIIGDMHSVALISKDGSVDYCSMPHIDSPTVFASLLDDEKGGFFSITPEEEFTSQQQYIENTNILKCSFKTKTGEAVGVITGYRRDNFHRFDAPLSEWQKEKDKIKEDILEKGYDSNMKSFIRRYGFNELDSSLLLLPLVNFLPVDDERIKNTIKACREKMMKQGFLLRYSSDDGLEGEEGGFILCNFWLIE